MKDYSQNGEQKIILDYFGRNKGILLDIGANDGMTLSNSFALLLQDWKGVLIEPSKITFEKLKRNTKILDVECYNVAISDIPGNFTFYESGTHLKKGDTSLLSTLCKSELDRWQGSDNSFIETTCEAITYSMLLEICEYDKFDFISIDAEALDVIILKQIDLSNTKMLCIEYNNNEVTLNEIIKYCSKFGLNKIALKNYENIILCR